MRDRAMRNPTSLCKFRYTNPKFFAIWGEKGLVTTITTQNFLKNFEIGCVIVICVTRMHQFDVFLCFGDFIPVSHFSKFSKVRLLSTKVRHCWTHFLTLVGLIQPYQSLLDCVWLFHKIKRTRIAAYFAGCTDCSV